jgi:hypothetical protein
MTTIELNVFRRIPENRRSERDILTVEATPEELDQIQQASVRDFAVGSLPRTENQLQEVHESLRRIQTGAFGICAGCEGRHSSAGPKVAAILSVIESCRRMKLPVREYFGSVLPGLGNLPIHRVNQLTPAAWAASQR